MTTVGLDVGARQLTAVSVDQGGAVLARATRTVSGDVATVARKVLREVKGPVTDRIGITIPFEDDELPSALVAAVSDEFGAAPVAIKKGPALVLAETWCGAATSCQDVIAFAPGLC
jgi:predicted NBD/HSP70 family sugar kinase